MRTKRLPALVVVLVFALLGSLNAGAQAQQVEYLDAKPLSQVLTLKLRDVKPGPWQIPLILWGADLGTILADMDGTFRDEGLTVELFGEDNFAKQVQALIDGKTAYLRGTMGMINAAAEAVAQAGTELVVIHQLSWSVGGDTVVGGPKIKKPADLCGKTIGLQLYGPHMDYLANLLSHACGASLTANLKWFRELTLPTYDPGKLIVDPISAFPVSDELDAVMAIIPDALNLTSGGKVGSGAEGSVKGAAILVSTKTASRIIADVYAVRKDYLDTHGKEVQAFVHALLRGQEALVDLLANKASQQARYQQLLGKAADILLGAPQATGDIEPLIPDFEFAGHGGNIAFFTGKGTTRTGTALAQQIQSWFLKMGIMARPAPLQFAKWNWTALGQGLKPAQAVAATPKFDSKRAAKAVEERFSAGTGELEKWDKETLFQIEINFAPNQTTFPVEQYKTDYRLVIELAEQYGGALVVVEGHADPLGIERARQNKTPGAKIKQMERAVKNLSLKRAEKVLASILELCEQMGVGCDKSQFVASGVGVQFPKFPLPRTEEEWHANRRVSARVQNIEGELDKFVPLSKSSKP